MNVKTPEIENQLKQITQDPGVYLFYDRFDRIIYIGKAIKLRSRVVSYWNQSSWKDRPKLRFMVPKVKRIETIITKNEKEALIFEANLVFKHQPQYNVLLKDNKTFPWLVITYDESFPRLLPVRDVAKFKSKKKSKNKFFGPYTNTGAMYENLELVNELFPLRKKRVPQFRDRPCLNYHLNKCLGPCQNLVSEDEYSNMLYQVEMVLNGNHSDLKKLMTEEMYRHSEDLNFERAAKLRDRIKALETFNEHQNVISDDENLDQDVFALVYDQDKTLNKDEKDREHAEIACLQVFKTRKGKLINRDSLEIEFTENDDHHEVFESTFIQYYTKIADDEIPKDILLSQGLYDAGFNESQADHLLMIEDWLSERKGSKVKISIPRKGDKYAQIELARRNAKMNLHKIKLDNLESESKNINQALENLQKELDLINLPARIECFDISHIQGTNVVASMVCFIDGMPAKNEYRRFKMSKEQNNDFDNMKEVVYRRYRHYVPDEDNPEIIFTGQYDPDTIPNLIIIDGGKGQLSAAQEVMKNLNLLHIPMVGLAKREEEVFMPGEKRPVILERKSPELFLIQRIRNEAHRFAITYHRKLRAKSATLSVLDGIKGLGPAKKKRLLDKFSTVENIKKASEEELTALPGFNDKLAQNIKEALV
jgi:excinuclease ABC subunit C